MTPASQPVIAYDVKSAIKQELGDDFLLSHFITAEKIQSCATLLQQATDDFFTDAAPDLEQLELRITLPDWSKDSSALQTPVYNIKSLAKVLGCSLITELCVHLLSALENTQLSTVKKHAIFKKLIEALRLAFAQRIRDDGGAGGKALMDSLRAYLPA